MIYDNSFYNPRNIGSKPHFIVNNSEVKEYRGFQIVKHHTKEYHTIYNGKIVTMTVGNPKKFIDEFLDTDIETTFARNFPELQKLRLHNQK